MVRSLTLADARQVIRFDAVARWTRGRRLRARQRSWLVCMSSQISALVPSALSRRNAIGALTPARPFSSAESACRVTRGASPPHRVRKIVHVAHKWCLSVLVQIIDDLDVFPDEPVYQAPVVVDRDRVEPLSSPVGACRAGRAIRDRPAWSRHPAPSAAASTWMRTGVGSRLWYLA